MEKRIITIFKLFVLISAVLLLRFFYFQIGIGATLSKTAAAQRISSLGLEKSRGNILDRNLIPLTNRSKKYAVVLKPLYLKDNVNDLRRICEVMGLDFTTMKKEVEAGRAPILVEGHGDMKDLAAGLENHGVTIIHSLARYDGNTAAKHVLGYLNGTDGTGEAGIEKSFEDVLNNDKEDAVSVVTDARKNMVQGLGYRLLKLPAENRKLDVKLTLDYHIQAVVEDVMERYGLNGAVVVEDICTGDILAMASKPDFDQNAVSRYLDSPGKELFNKAVASYNLGSIFKIVDAALFYESGQDEQEAFFCNGSITVGGREFRCSSYGKGGHGWIRIEQAFALSCNPYFISLGLHSGYRNLIGTARKLGLGQATGIGVQGVEESGGSLPDIDGYYSDGDIANISIGQGAVMATPLQVADLVATVANGGIKNRVNIVDSVVDEEGNKVREVRLKEGKRVLPKEAADKVKQLMEAVTEAGTGTKAALERYGGAAGKTGSAETGIKDVVHAWFAGYFPQKTPKYSIAVFIEGGGSGGGTAAPVFAEIASEIMKKGY